MAYQVLKVYNNNVVLTNEKDREVILVSKGIGFGKKAGDVINTHIGIEKVFHEMSADQDNLEIADAMDYNQEILNITKKILQIAEKLLGKLNDTIEVSLKEHIEFAIERLKMGLEIENPFADEIIALYPKEYTIAQLGAYLIKERLGITIDEKEEGFIALHLYAARAHQSLNAVMKMTKLYKACIGRVEEAFHQKICLKEELGQNFLMSLTILIKTSMQAKEELGQKERQNHKEKTNQKEISGQKEDIEQKEISESCKVAMHIAGFLQEEKDIIFSDTQIEYLARDIEKLIQLMA